MILASRLILDSVRSSVRMVQERPSVFQKPSLAKAFHLVTLDRLRTIGLHPQAASIGTIGKKSPQQTPAKAMARESAS